MIRVVNYSDGVSTPGRSVCLQVSKQRVAERPESVFSEPRLLGLLTSPSHLLGSAILLPGLSGCHFYTLSGTA